MFPFSAPITGGITPLLTATASPTSVSGSRSGAGTTTSNSTTVTATNPIGSPSFAWTCTGGISVTSPTSASTTFSCALGNGSSVSGTATCTVTDTGGRVATCAVPVSLTSTYVSPYSVSIGATGGPPDSTGSGPGAGPFNMTVAASPSNGVGPYNYSWTLQNVNGSAVSFTTGTTSSSASVTWHNISAWQGFSAFCNVRCDVFDTGTGQTAAAIIQIIDGR